ncbi:MAG: hypothetical protein ACREF3_18170 [Acetobacteraceae bacterium]
MKNPLRRAKPREQKATEPAVEVPDTLLAAALRLLTADGMQAAAERLEADPSLLPGLARHVIDARRATALAVWGQAVPFDYRSPVAKALDAAKLPGERLFRKVSGYPHPSRKEMVAAVAPIVGHQGELAGVVLLFVKPDGSGLYAGRDAEIVIGQQRIVRLGGAGRKARAGQARDHDAGSAERGAVSDIHDGNLPQNHGVLHAAGRAGRTRREAV